MSLGPERKKSIWTHPVVVAAVVPAVVTGIVTVIVAVLSGSPGTSEPPPPGPVTDSPAPPAQAAAIKVDQNTDPALCATFAGDGDIPEGRTLWLAVQSDERKYYFFPTVPDPAQHRWIAENVTLGIPEEKPGEPFTVLAVLADATGERNIEKLDGAGARSLPAGVAEQHRTYVKRGRDERPCQE